MIPNDPGTMTPVWFTGALRASGVLAGAVVATATYKPLNSQGWTAQIARFTLTYDPVDACAPSTLVTKSSSLEESTRSFFSRFYEREVAFYRHVAPHGFLRVPQCYYAAYNATTHAHVVLLEDLDPSEAGDLTAGASVEDAVAYTERIAAFHAYWWERRGLDELLAHFPPHGSTFADDYARLLDRGLAVMGPYVAKRTSALAAGLRGSLQARWKRHAATPRTLTHWDAHTANCLMPSSAGGDWAVVDWQYCAVARGIWDVARFCTMSLPSADRRAVQRDIVALYVETLSAHGVQDYTFPQCFEDYQEAMVLQFAQQLCLYARLQHWNDARRRWVEAVTPRVVAALHDAEKAIIGS